MSCNTFPTLTATSTLTTESLSTSLTTSVITNIATPPIHTSIRPCGTVASGSSSPIPCTPATVLVTEPPTTELQTVQVPFVVTIPITQTVTTTLYGSSCSSSDTPTLAQTSTPTFTTFVVTKVVPVTSHGTTFFTTLTTSESTTVPASGPGGGGTASSGRIIPIAVGSVAGLIACFMAVVAFVWILRKRRLGDDMDDPIHWPKDPLSGPPTAADSSSKPDRPFFQGGGTLTVEPGSMSQSSSSRGSGDASSGRNSTGAYPNVHIHPISTPTTPSPQSFSNVITDSAQLRSAQRFTPMTGQQQQPPWQNDLPRPVSDLSSHTGNESFSSALSHFSAGRSPVEMNSRVEGFPFVSSFPRPGSTSSPTTRPFAMTPGPEPAPPAYES